MKLKPNKKIEVLLNSFPSGLLEKIGQQTEVDKNVSRLFGDRMFKLLLYGMLRNERISTRFLEEIYNESAFFQKYSGKGGHRTRHSSLADRLDEMNADYFEQLFEWTREKYGPKLNKQAKFKQIKSFDSTMVRIGAGLVEWGMQVGKRPKQGKGHKQFKFTMGFYGKLPGSVRTFLNQEHLGEEVALKKAIQSANLTSGDLIVFDRGLRSRQTLKEFDEQSLRFVTRGGQNTRYEVLEDYRQIKGRTADDLVFEKDVKVHLYGNSKQIVEHPFRLIVAHTVTDKPQQLVFITNIWNLNAMQIARIYRQRWDIEVFFRMLKQNLGIKHLINRSENGIKIQIYCALIVAIILIVAKEKLKSSSFRATRFLLEENFLIILFQDLEVNFNPLE